MERDRGITTRSFALKISTHTLTWSVTQKTAERNDGIDISTHTLTWSVTINGSVMMISEQISTHTLTWSVTCGEVYQHDGKFISTHTLTWSVTQTCLSQSIVYIFQLTRSRGAWPAEAEKDSVLKDFNSHAHVERDLGFLPNQKDHIYFNSHAHVERDVWYLAYLVTLLISTHTLTWSVTRRR